MVQPSVKAKPCRTCYRFGEVDFPKVVVFKNRIDQFFTKLKPNNQKNRNI